MNDKFLKNDVDNVASMVSKLIHDFSDEFYDDAALLHGMITGETDFTEIMERIYSERALTDEAILGAKARETELKARRERLERKSDALRDMMLKLMQTAQQTKVELVEATLSVRKPSKSVEIYDENHLPQGTFELVRKPLKAVIKTWVEAGQVVPGARLVEGQPGLMVKRS